MPESIFETVIAALEHAGVRYVVVGGFAVVLQGYGRFTADMDIAVDLRPDEAGRAMNVLTGLGLRPRAPISPEEFGDAEARQRWRTEKGMQVLSMWDPANPMRVVDVFVENPMEFDELWNRSEVAQLSTTRVRFASIEDLIEMKERAGRPQDLDDVAALRELRRTRETNE